MTALRNFVIAPIRFPLPAPSATLLCNTWLFYLATVRNADRGEICIAGAWVGLMGALAIGPRRNRFGNHGAPIPGHSMTLVGLGTYILWLGWFGFNPGSQLDADAASISHITVTTNLAAAAGSLSALFLGWYTVGKPQLPWGLNGALAGLVSITASTNAVTPLEAVIIGAIGGVIMYYGVNFLESREVDDVVGAVSIHGFCGVWGTLAVGIFAAETGLLHGGGLDQLISANHWHRCGRGLRHHRFGDHVPHHQRHSGPARAGRRGNLRVGYLRAWSGRLPRVHQLA